jgi:hypothetical protein
MLRPGQPNGDVSIVGANSSATLFQSSVIGLPPGNYTVTARSVTSGGRTFLPTTATFNLTVAANSPTTLTITYESVSLAINAGDNQVAMAGSPVFIAPSVAVRRSPSNVPVPGAFVTFYVTAGNGTITGNTAVTTAQGIATLGSWQLGAPQRNVLGATVTSLGADHDPVAFSAAGCETNSPGVFNFTICYQTDMTSDQRTSFGDAAMKWVERDHAR